MSLFKHKNQKYLIYANLRAFLTLTLAIPLPEVSYALTGHFKSAFFLQENNNFSKSPTSNNDLYLGDLRLMSKQYHKAWTFAIDYQVQASSGKILKSTLNQNPDFTHFDQQQMFNLTQVLHKSESNDTANLIYQRIDRLSANYTNIDYSITIGRQALSIGNGLVFHPLDRFNPFAPNQFDRDYKPGIDMLTLQKILSDGNEVSAVVLPRRNLQNHEVTLEDSSWGFKLYRYGKYDNQWLLQKDAHELVLANQWSGNWQQGLWNLDMAFSYDSEFQQQAFNAIVNYQSAFMVAQHNLLSFIELYYNGYGIAQAKPNVSELPASLLAKQASGKTFMLNQWYLATGTTIELTPLTQLATSIIFNLQDAGTLLNLNATYSLNNQNTLRYGYQQSFAPTGSEFSGLLNKAGQAQTAYEKQLFVNWTYYF